MNKYCHLCGNELRNNSKYCSSCGAKIPKNDIPDKSKIKIDKDQDKNKRSFKILFTFKAACCLIIVILFIFTTITISTSYRKPIKKFLSSVQSTDVVSFQKSIVTLPTQDNNKTTEKLLKDKVQELKNNYGDNIKITPYFSGKIALSKEQMSIYENTYNIIIDKCYHVCVKLKISGDKNTTETFTQFTVGKVKGKWIIIITSDLNNNIV